VKDKPQVRFTDIAGLEDVKEEIRLKMIYPLQHPELAGRYGIRAGGGVLLYGPPGTGKTLMARAIAGELDATIFVITPGQILSKWVGEAEQNLMKLFDAARAEESSLIFMDEIDALVPRRRSDGSTVMQRVVPQILQELEGFEVRTRPMLFMGATNRPWMLDEAMCRPGRLDALIHVPLPDAPARYRMLEMYLGQRPLADDVDLGALCDRLEGYSGADIASIAQRAARTAFLESIAGQQPRAVTMEDIVHIIAQTRPSVSAADLARFERFGQAGA
jgi:transitional endoplasmic reticulum ATPase